MKLTLDNVDIIDALNAEIKLFEHYNISFLKHYVMLNELKIRVLEIGSGEPLIIVPGNTGDGFPFIPLLPEIKNRRILIINRPGGGLSEGIDHRQLDFKTLANEALNAVLDHFNLESVDIVAHSMGGQWSLWYSIANPKRVKKLILLGVPGNIIDTRPPFALRLTSVPILNSFLFDLIKIKNIKKAFNGLKFMGHNPNKLNDLPEEMRYCYYYFQRLPHYKISSLSLMQVTNGLFRTKSFIDASELKLLKQPLLMIWGDNDPFGKIKTAYKIQEITHAELHIEHGGHLIWLDNPSLCGNIIMNFLERN
jgi:pimeloyl-ACP methyl ester carboxylesterase